MSGLFLVSTNKLDGVGPLDNRPSTDYNHHFVKKKSRIGEIKHLSTDADSNTDTTVGWTKNTQKLEFIEKEKKSSKTEKLKNA